MQSRPLMFLRWMRLALCVFTCTSTYLLEQPCGDISYMYVLCVCWDHDCAERDVVEQADVEGELRAHLERPEHTQHPLRQSEMMRGRQQGTTRSEMDGTRTTMMMNDEKESG